MSRFLGRVCALVIDISLIYVPPPSPPLSPRQRIVRDDDDGKAHTHTFLLFPIRRGSASASAVFRSLANVEGVCVCIKSKVNARVTKRSAGAKIKVSEVFRCVGRLVEGK